MKTDQSNVLLHFDYDLPSAGTNGWSSFNLHYYQKLGILFTIMGKFSSFLNREMACIRLRIWPRKILDFRSIQYSAVTHDKLLECVK